MRRLLTALLLLIGLTGSAYAQATGRAANMPVRTDANGYLAATAYQITAPVNSAGLFANTFIKTDANGYLIVAIAGGGSLEFAEVCLGSGAQDDICLSRVAAGQLGVNKDSTHGVVLNVATDARLQCLTRAGADDCDILAEDFIATDLINAVRHGFVNTGTYMSSPSDGDISFFNSGDTGVRLNFDSAGVAHFMATNAADTATVRASVGRFGTGNFATSGAVQLANASIVTWRNAANNDNLGFYLNSSDQFEVQAPVKSPAFAGQEQSDFAAPAANFGIIYFRDNGGKTELVARFNTGAIQRIAIEP